VSNIQSIIDHTKNHALELYRQSGNIHPYFDHFTNVEKISLEIAKLFPDADRNVLILSAWLHDVGRFIGPRDVHAINSEIEARRYLGELGLDKKIIDEVAHCVRSHRNDGLEHEIIEAKIITVADSADHIIAGPYTDMLHKYSIDHVVGKLERDYRDLHLIPEVEKQLAPVYKAWKKLLELLPKELEL